MQTHTCVQKRKFTIVIGEKRVLYLLLCIYYIIFCLQMCFKESRPFSLIAMYLNV